MRLADFIRHDIEAILAEWEAFAATLLPAADGMTSLALRDHAQAILEAVATDLETTQTRHAQSEKSKGRAPVLASAPETAAQTHAVLRAKGGFDIKQLVAEYRALRASVLRLWMDHAAVEASGLEDVIRFNEAIDQAIAESVSRFDAQVEKARNLFLGMLGHDMRNPLNAIVATAAHLKALNAGEEVSVAATRLVRSGKAMQTLLDDLVDFNRTRLGLGIKVTPAEANLAEIAADEVEQLKAAHPDRVIELSASGDNRGTWDGRRVQQLLRNLISNAIRYGDSDTPVRVAIRGNASEVRIDVANIGIPIDADQLRQLFEPLKRGLRDGRKPEPRESLGLGLFIVREIARAHGGDVDVESASGVTTFAVRLPRRTAAG